MPQSSFGQSTQDLSTRLAGEDQPPPAPPSSTVSGETGDNTYAASPPSPPSGRHQGRATSSGTPTKGKRSGKHPSIQGQGAETVQDEMSRELIGEIVGPMPLEDFLAEFCPGRARRSDGRIPVDHFDRVPTRASATDINEWETKRRKKFMGVRKHPNGKKPLEKDMYAPIVCQFLFP